MSRPAVVGAGYSTPGSPGRSYHRRSLRTETHLPGGILLSPPWKERSLLARASLFQFGPGHAAGRAGQAGWRAGVLCFLVHSFSSRWARPLQQLHPPTLMPALDRLSCCKSTRRLMCCRQSSSRAMSPIHAQFRHAPLGMHPSLFISIPRQGHGIKPGPAAAGPSMMTGLTGHEGRRPTTLK